MNQSKKNETWNSYRKKSVALEKGFIIATLIIVAVGIVCDIVVCEGIFLLPVDDFNGYLLAIMGIQATISTLSIAVVALISGNVSEIYMGVSVSHYYLNIRPLIFKHNRIAYISFFLIAVSCILYVFSLYNCLIAVFVLTVLLIVLSIYEIYFLFRGLQNTKQEVQMYVWEQIEIKNKNINSTMLNFANDWSSKVGEQTQSEYELYKVTFLHAFDILLKDNTQETLSFLSDLCGEHISCCLKDEKVQVKVRGIELLIDIYDNLWFFVIGENFECGHTQKFDLLGKTLDELKEALKVMPLSVTKTIFRWNHFIDTVIRTACHIVSNENEIDSSNDIQSAFNLSWSIGYVLKHKELVCHEYVQDTLNYWGGNLNRMYLDSSYNIPKEKQDKFLNCKCKNSFYYFRGLIENEYVDIIKDNVFFRALSNSIHRLYKNQAEITYYLLVDCYLYYLAEKESLDCIEESLKKAAKNVLSDKKIIGLNKYLFLKANTFITDRVNLEKEVCRIMQNCERFPKYDNGKTLIMQDVVREFFVFMQLFSSDRLEISEDPYVYIHQFLEVPESQTKEILSKFYEIFHDADAKNIDAQIDDSYSVLKTVLYEKYKEEELKKASEDQKKYLAAVDEKGIIQSIQRKLKEHFEKIFGDLNIQSKKENKKWVANLNLVSVNLFTDMVNENIENIYEQINAIFVNSLISELLKKKKISHISRKNFKTDDDFIEFLSNNRYKTLIGSEYIFGSCDYKNHNKFVELFENSTCIFHGYYQSGGVALKNGYLKINIKNVYASIRPALLDDIEYHYDEEKDLLSYDVTNGIELPFKKEELIKYLHNKRKVLDLSASVEFVVSDEEIGVHIERNDS